LFLMVYFSATMFAADKPAWTIDYKKLNLPKHPKPVEVGKEQNHNPGYTVQFTPDNNVLISFWERRPQTELATKDSPDKSGSVFVVLLLSIETGEPIRRIEWPVMGESLFGQRIRHGSRIYPLHSDGYVGIINRHLQVHDSSFNIIFDRLLENKYEMERYDLITPLHGQFFIFGSWDGVSCTIEIIDSKTFKTIEQWNESSHIFNMSSLLMDIWGDQLLLTRHTTDFHGRNFFVKKIGTSKWNDLGTLPKVNVYAKFIYNGIIVFTGYIEQMFDSKEFWFKIENGKVSEPIFEGLQFKPSLNTSIVAAGASHLSDFRRTFDMDSKDWIEAYDLNTRQVLLATKRYSASDIVDYAISPDGDSIVLMTKKKIELYNVNPKKAKKK